MANVLYQYYRGITFQLRSEVDFINSLFKHQGIKGAGNEGVLRELITRFIPKRYGIGSGVVIDRKGNQSRQCDVIIYDVHSYPSLLSLTTVHLFPVDIVLATIEIKTTLTSGTASDAIENISSVRTLEIIDRQFMLPEPSAEGGINFIAYKGTPPMGVIFSYNSIAQKFEIFKDWFTPPDPATTRKYPILVACMDQGIVRFADISQSSNTSPNAFALPYVEAQDETETKILQANTKSDSAIHNGFVYPVKEINKNRVLIDQSRVLLLFLLLLNEYLSLKKINPTIRFTEHYLDAAMSFCIEC